MVVCAENLDFKRNTDASSSRIPTCPQQQKNRAPAADLLRTSDHQPFTAIFHTALLQVRGLREFPAAMKHQSEKADCEGNNVPGTVAYPP